MNVTIFTADIIYHLFDQFTRHRQRTLEEEKAKAQDVAVFPCMLQILKNAIFNQKDPIIVGVEVVEGILKVGTPLCIPKNGVSSEGPKKPARLKSTSVLCSGGGGGQGGGSMRKGSTAGLFDLSTCGAEHMSQRRAFFFLFVFFCLHHRDEPPRTPGDEPCAWLEKPSRTNSSPARISGLGLSFLIGCVRTISLGLHSSCTSAR